MKKLIRAIWLPRNQASLLILLPLLLFAGLAQDLVLYISMSIIMLQSVAYKWMSDLPTRSLQNTLRRLNDYAHLKNSSNEQEQKLSDLQTRLLSPMAHEVLLGTLKKVEAKAGSLLVVYSLTLTITITVLVENCGGVCSGIDEASLYFILYAHIWPMILLFLCFSHDASWADNEHGSAGLQVSLITSLRSKEMSLSFAYQQGSLLLIFVASVAASAIRN